MTSQPRYEWYQTDGKTTITVYVKNAEADKVKIEFAPKSLVFSYGDQQLVLEPLPTEINTDASSYTVMKMKVEIGLVKKVAGRWQAITGEQEGTVQHISPEPSTSNRRKARKNWDAVTTEILSSEKEKSVSDDPNIGGDVAANEMFAKLYADADEDVKKAMIKSYTESNGTSLSMNWDEVKKARVEPYKSKDDDDKA
ncbi:CS-domain-containing protein [Dacryopinax primogenitus]|uniref:CS-domain-containing protein n=1 Tax=Dacryopinax primogenitus (strain DJM 731) TaxID=1858805 RepID=M5FWH6_DACPD|nr:CS-domain-containing protein [Dacryopinax primogenitus]EJT97756.1 CS-domain-containing protein [Dacryopinax primogenitus]